jgi:hypothetical protein
VSILSRAENRCHTAEITIEFHTFGPRKLFVKHSEEDFAYKRYRNNCTAHIHALDIINNQINTVMCLGAPEIEMGIYVTYACVHCTARSG